MQTFKLHIKAGLSQRNFEIDQLVDQDSELPWWMVERWIVKRVYDHKQFYIVFLPERQWESGTKIVSEVLICEEVPTSYDYEKKRIATLSLVKGNFDDKLIAFWEEFDAGIS